MTYDYFIDSLNAAARPTPSARRAYFDGVRRAAEQMIAALEPGGRWPSWVDIEVPDLPHDDFDPRVAAAWIRDAAKAGIAAVAPAVGTRPAHVGDIAMAKFIDALCSIYSDCWGRKATVSWSTAKIGPAKPGGPCFRFCAACLAEAGALQDSPRIEWTPASLADRIRSIHRLMGKSSREKT